MKSSRDALSLNEKFDLETYKDLAEKLRSKKQFQLEEEKDPIKSKESDIIDVSIQEILKDKPWRFIKFGEKPQ